LKEPCLSKGAANLDLVVSPEGRLFQGTHQEGGRVRPAPLRECLNGLGVKGVHAGQYTWYTRDVNSPPVPRLATPGARLSGVLQGRFNPNL
jgi:hypothetical protein